MRRPSKPIKLLLSLFIATLAACGPAATPLPPTATAISPTNTPAPIGRPHDHQTGQQDESVRRLATVSLLGLVVILKNVLGIPAEVLSRDVILFIILCSAFGIGYPEHPEGSPPPPLDRPWLWSLFVILMTAAIVVVYAI